MEIIGVKFDTILGPLKDSFIQSICHAKNLHFKASGELFDGGLIEKYFLMTDKSSTLKKESLNQKCVSTFKQKYNRNDKRSSSRRKCHSQNLVEDALARIQPGDTRRKTKTLQLYSATLQ